MLYIDNLHFQTSLEVKEDLHSAQFLIIKNPKWGISLIDINDDNEATTETLDTLVNTLYVMLSCYFWDVFTIFTNIFI